jgi:hypothetical protein
MTFCLLLKGIAGLGSQVDLAKKKAKVLVKLGL